MEEGDRERMPRGTQKQGCISVRLPWAEFPFASANSVDRCLSSMSGAGVWRHKASGDPNSSCRVCPMYRVSPYRHTGKLRLEMPITYIGNM